MDSLAASLLPDLPVEPLPFLLLGSLSAMIMSLAKAGFGGSIALLSLPLMVYACGNDGRLANGVMLPVLIVCDYVAIVPWRWKWNLRVVMELLPGAVVGIGLGWAALWAFQHMGQTSGRKEMASAWINLSIGVIAFLFVVLQIVSAIRARAIAFRPVLWQGMVVGTAAGFTSTLAHAAGPIVTMYMLPRGMSKGQYVSSTVLYYWIGNQLKLIPFFALGMLGTGTLGASLYLMPAVVIGTLAGLYLHHRVRERSFTGIVYALLAIAGADLVCRNAYKLWFNSH